MSPSNIGTWARLLIANG